ncbi:MAG: hypothetical protein ACLGI6_15265 [Gammaproteobacteria bacterium]
MPAHLPSAPGLLDQFLPQWTFGHRYAITVNSGDIDAVYDIARNVDLAKSPLIPPLLKLRGLPADRLDARAFTAAMGWTELAHVPGQEFIIGYWRSHRIEPVSSCAQFCNDTPGATQKVAFSFRFRRVGPNQVEVDTETRVLCIGRRNARAYRLYWLAIRPFSALIRKEILKIIKRDAEARAARELRT